MIRLLFVWLAILLLPTTALAECLTQKTAVLYLNGVDTEERGAQRSITKLKGELSKVNDINPNCIIYDYVYNTNELLFADFLEAGIQKIEEQKRSLPDFWRKFFRVLPLLTNDPIFDLLADFYLNTNAAADLGRFVLGDQIDEHIEKYREHLREGRKIIIVSHSQGNLYANEEWDKLTEAEKNAVNIVAVATPAELVAKNGPYTTLAEDGVAKFLFPLALPANAANEEKCNDDWTCHGFKESYLHGEQSRKRIIEGIIALLPTEKKSCRIEGLFKDWNDAIVSDGKVSLLDNLSGNPVVETASDATGYYCIAGVPDGYYFIEASRGDQVFGGNDIRLQPGLIEPLRINFPIAVQM